MLPPPTPPPLVLLLLLLPLLLLLLLLELLLLPLLPLLLLLLLLPLLPLLPLLLWAPLLPTPSEAAGAEDGRRLSARIRRRTPSSSLKPPLVAARCNARSSDPVLLLDRSNTCRMS